MERVLSLPDDSFERAALARGCVRIAGVDEVGRGPLAGPVTAAAVVLDPVCIPEGLNDSKKLSQPRREAIYAALLETADVSVAHASVAEIDELNILWASHLAMRRAVEGLSPGPDYILVDGNRVPERLPCGAEALVEGDARSLSIAAASIAAKVCRDRIMVELAQQYPGYGWDKNAGYGTKAHLEGLKSHGVTQHHRRSFRPVHNILYQDSSLTD